VYIPVAFMLNNESLQRSFHSTIESLYQAIRLRVIRRRELMPNSEMVGKLPYRFVDEVRSSIGLYNARTSMTTYNLFVEKPSGHLRSVIDRSAGFDPFRQVIDGDDNIPVGLVGRR